ncbi:MAG: tRNA 5-methoxyuridine(34)/uridine 5-oxyacetic acid(34) synthase CmoB [Proteobacteria bacterium]|nr:tRNA 5-methoxyuridine(34)/uridine 5-oxyacetic acid(34) synthase CmoB [Pseudomonadota bacterium]
MNDYLKKYSETIHLDEINKVREERALWLSKKGARPYIEAVDKLPEFKSEKVDFSGDVITVGNRGELTEDQFDDLHAATKTLLPWRKGPFQLFEHFIDSEWKSNLKWDRVQPHLIDLKGKVVADIGCNNGYYMFRMAHHHPELVVGFDPMPRFQCAFDLVNRFAGFNNLKFELLGAEHVHLFRNLFDTVLCMGVLYHNRNPIQILSGIWESMKPGGQLIIEAQGIPGEGSYALFPEDRYAKARNVWFVPTVECLSNWIKRVGFKDVECFSIEKTTSEEQRKTEYAPWESLDDFLDPNDRSKTVEGYPAPVRICIKARKFMN